MPTTWPPSCIDELTAEPPGLDVAYEPKCTAEELPARIGDAAILVVRSTKVTRAAIEAAPRLALIVRAGAGYDTIDVAAASERGIFVSNCPGKNSVAVAELAMGLILALDRRIVDATADLRAGRWNKKEYGKAEGLEGRTLGLAGLGRIGREVARSARAAFDMRVLAWSIPFDEELARAAGGRAVRATLHELVEQSDVVSVHLPQTVETQAPLQRRRLRAHEAGRHLRQHEPRRDRRRGGAGAGDEGQGASRGARRLRCRAGRRATAEFRPAVADAGTSPARTTSARAPSRRRTPSPPRRCASAASSCDRAACPTSSTSSSTRRPSASSSCGTTTRSGVLASVLGILRNHGANVEDMSNTIFQGAKTAVAAIRLTQEPSAEAIAEIRGAPGFRHRRRGEGAAALRHLNRSVQAHGGRRALGSLG